MARSAPAAEELRGGFEGVWVRFLTVFLDFLGTELCRLAVLCKVSGNIGGILRMAVARTFAGALAARLWDEWLAFVSDGEVPTFAGEFAARGTELLPRLLCRGDAGGRPASGGFCTEEMIAEDLVGAPRRIRGEALGARDVIVKGHVHQGLVVPMRPPAPREGKPRQRTTTTLYLLGSVDAHTMCARALAARPWVIEALLAIVCRCHQVPGCDLLCARQSAGSRFGIQESGRPGLRRP